MSALRPLEIIGGGLAGLSLARALRRREVPVTVYEAGEYPRHRVCGEFITGLGEDTIAALDLSSVLEQAVRLREVAWYRRGEKVGTDRLPRPALGLSRHVLDPQLAAEFSALGGDLRTGVRVTGQNSTPGRIFAVGRRRGRSKWVGLKIHARDLPLTSDLELHLGDHAYVGMSRVDENTVNVCGLFNGERLRDRTNPDRLQAMPHSAAAGFEWLLSYLRAGALEDVASRLAGVEVDLSSWCAVAALTFQRPVGGTKEVRLGDAYAMIPPFTGNGMAMAFQSAAIALEPMLGYARGTLSWADAVQVTNAHLHRQFRVRLASANLLHGALMSPLPQSGLALLTRTGLLPFRPLYALLH